MQIQCPHCKSRYRLGAEVIDAYGGFVRCGNCNYKFNIHDQVNLDLGQGGLVNTQSRPTQDLSRAKPDDAKSPPTRIEPKLEGDNSEEEINIRFGPGEIEGQYELTSLASQEAKEPLLEPSEPDAENDNSGMGHYSEITDEMEPALNGGNPEEDDSEDDGSESYGLEDDLEEDGSEEDGSEEDGSEEDGSEDYDSEDYDSEDYFTNFDARNEELGEYVEERTSTSSIWGQNPERDEALVFESPTSGVVENDSNPIVLTHDNAGEHEPEAGFFSLLFFMVWGAVRFIFWTVAAIALAYLLFGQLKETLYPAYKNNPNVQQLRAVACEYLPCGNSDVNIDLFEIVVSRMDEINQPSRQLHVSIFLLNRAEYAQAYPNILITLKTIDGSTIGQRVIQPEEYFTSYDSLISSPAGLSTVEGALVKPNKLGKILIKLKAPPTAAVGFEARVVR